MINFFPEYSQNILKFFHYYSKCLYLKYYYKICHPRKILLLVKVLFWWRLMAMNLKQSRRQLGAPFYSIPLYVQPLVTNNRIHILFWTLLWCRFLGNDDYIQSWYSLWRVSINFASSNMGHRWITRKFPETPKLKMISHEIQLKMLWSIHLITCIPDICLGWNWRSLLQIIAVTFFCP